MEKKTMRPFFFFFFFLPLIVFLSFPRTSNGGCAPRSKPLVSHTPPSPSSDHPPPSSTGSTNVLQVTKLTGVDLHSKASSALDPSIKATCDRTTYPDLCFSSIKPLLNANAALYLKDTTDVGITPYLELLVQAGKQQTKQAIQEFSKGAHEPGVNPATATILKGCVSKYGTATNDFDTVLKAIAAKDIPTAQTFLSGVLTYYSTCTDGDAPGDPTLPASSPWVRKSKNLVNLVDNCLDLCSLLK